jgi:hypothetical protein
MTTPETQISFEIVNGGSREDIRDSIGSKPSFRILVGMTVNVKYDDVLRLNWDYEFPKRKGYVDVLIVVDSLEWEDGSGESFNLKGRLKAVDSTKSKIPFSGYYRTDIRKGLITLLV